jgi:hypothetical protein
MSHDQMHYIQSRGIGQKEEQALKLTRLFGGGVRYTFKNEIAGEVKDKNNGSRLVQAKQSLFLR